MKSIEEFKNKVIHGDCLEVMKEMEDNSVDLVLIDPPYNIGKDKQWDKWKTVNKYIEFMGTVFVQCERILKNNGSFYFFHNDFLQIVELQNWLNNNSKFIFKQFIVWNKKFKGASNECFLQGFNEVEGLRNYQKMVEYCLYYTFQDKTGLTTVMTDINNFSTLRNYFKKLQEYIGLSIKLINKKLGHRGCEHCFYWGTTQWDLGKLDRYKELSKAFNLYEWEGFIEYEELRKEYEELRYTFNNQKSHHSVWDYEITKKQGHITPKPKELIKNILKYSSNKGDIILDCFAGSGTTGVACKELGRNYILIEKEKKYIDIINKRLENTTISLFN